MNKRRQALLILGMVAACLSQYAWLIPLSQAYLVCCLVALICAVVAAIWFYADWLKQWPNRR